MTVVNTRPRPELEQWAAGRRPYLDNLKVVLIAAIIAIHGVLGYSTFEAWTYSPVRETTLSPVSEVAFFVLAGPFGLFLIALLFLVAGLLTTGSLARKGPARFARDRLLRLGVPFAVFVLWTKRPDGFPPNRSRSSAASRRCWDHRPEASHRPRQRPASVLRRGAFPRPHRGRGHETATADRPRRRLVPSQLRDLIGQRSHPRL